MQKIIIAVLVILSIAGCGGGGGGSSTALLTTGSTIRQIQDGDTLTYSVSGTFTPYTGSSLSASGTLTITTFNDTTPALFGGRILKQVYDINVHAGTHSLVFASPEYYEQIANGTIYDLGTTGEMITDANIAPITKNSPASVGGNYSYSAHYSDGLSSENSWNVTALEYVGNQQAYKYHSVMIVASESSTMDDWFVPDWGYSVKQTLAIDDTDGTWQITATETSKNF